MDPDSWPKLLLIPIAIIILLFCAAYFAVAETALASVSRIRIKTRLERGDARAQRTMYILDNFDKAITTVLIGTNVTHLVVASLSTLFATRLWGLSATALTTVVTTIVVFFAAEMLPKSIGKKHSEKFSLAVSASLCFFMKIFSPISFVLTAIGRGVARLTKGDTAVTVTEEELYDIIENMTDEGELGSERGELVQSALMFADVTAESVLTPRVDVAALDAESDCEEILARIKSYRHSRLPVYRGSIDNVIGVLQIRKYLKAYMREGASVELLPLLDEPYFIHRSTKIDELLPEMSRKKRNIAIVTDSYGGMLGIVTVEDILEELVGEIWDEDDIVVEPCVRMADGSCVLQAELSVEEAFELVGFEDPDDVDFEHQIIGEWTCEQFERLPNEGEEFTYNGLRVSVESKKKNRIVSLRFYPPLAGDEGEEAAK
ncbi:MAG: HlyC/CorC family transporter [Oscillospiraceae bacterium]|nr:HlyC/CorC family transporter [Oscillospiraceae bacterium]